MEKCKALIGSIHIRYTNIFNGQVLNIDMRLLQALCPGARNAPARASQECTQGKMRNRDEPILTRLAVDRVKP